MYRTSLPLRFIHVSFPDPGRFLVILLVVGSSGLFCCGYPCACSSSRSVSSSHSCSRSMFLLSWRATTSNRFIFSTVTWQVVQVQVTHRTLHLIDDEGGVAVNRQFDVLVHRSEVLDANVLGPAVADGLPIFSSSEHARAFSMKKSSASVLASWWCL